MPGVALVGFMGTGKTEVGKILACRLQRVFNDTDTLIVQIAGKPITRIFAEDGEPIFRKWESEVLEKLTRSPEPAVTATGGGIVLAAANWPRLHQLGRVVCLQADPEVILRRVGTAQDRPLLAGSRQEVRRRITALLEERSAAYARADWCCDTSQLSPEAVAGEIIQWMQAEGLMGKAFQT